MIKNYSLKGLIATSLVFASSFAFSQQYKCASDEIHNYNLANDPIYKQKMDDYETALINAKQINGGQNINNVIYRIPVVVHVMHKGEAVGTGTNVSDQAIMNGIKYLNQRYRKIAGTPGDGNGVDVEIEFALAVRDENGNCTNGITRTDMSGDATYMQYGVKRSGANGITDAALKAIISWNQTQYYNIWLISEIDDNNGGSGTQGYAYYASSHGSASDGAVMLGNSFISQSRITIAHELGHALNLYHTFEGDNSGASCPTGNQCGSGLGDCCADTPPHIRTTVSTCTDVANSCDGGTPAELHIPNYMDYSADACQNMFTADQKTRMIAALTTLRSSFLESNGNMSLVPVVSPGIAFSGSSGFLCAGNTVDFTDNSTCAPNTFINTPWTATSHNWTFTNNAGTTYTSTDQNPSITFLNPGTYDATLSITNPGGTASNTLQGFIIVSNAPTAPTCTGASTYTATLTYGIYQVHLNDMSHYSSGTYGDIQSGATNASGYGDFSCSAGTILEPNTTYTISIKGTSSAGLVEDFKAYIDYNNNGDFTDPGEEIATWDSIPGSANLLNASFTTPATAVMNTSLRMRVFSGRSSETITPCFTTARGQIQDYSVWITDKVATVNIIANPSGTVNYGTNVTFTATPVNGGSSPTYQWYVNGVAVSGANAATYSSTTLNNNDQVYCVLISNMPEVVSSPATSNTISMSINGAVALNDHSQTSFIKIYPNPNKGLFELSFSGTDKSEYAVEITNVLGQTVYKNNVFTSNGVHTSSIDLSKQDAGMYFVTVRNNKAKQIKKIIIQ